MHLRQLLSPCVGQIRLVLAAVRTGGVRAEQNTQFGDSLGTPVSPRFGLSYARGTGWGMVKLRGSYGRSIRAPSPGQEFAVVTPTNVVLANPALGPERQRGWDAGFDAILGPRVSLSATYYDQIADDLIQLVLLQTSPVPTSQNQNVGRVKNSGVEIEGTVDAGPVRLKTQYGYARSRIDALAPNYAGDLRVGDQSLLTPKHTAGASLSLTPWRGTSLGAGLTYVGSWSYYDWLALFRCFGGTGPCRATMRDYITPYPSFVKVNATVWQQITPLVSGFVSVDNLTNNEAFEFHNFSPVVGRVTTVGLRLQY
jgi:outer membrane receptor protein involved in Fe transport